MTRALAPKAAASLLRNEFSTRGLALSYTESLDIAARLQGYQAWSHLQSAGGEPAIPVAVPVVEPKPPEFTGLLDSVQALCGLKVLDEAVQYPRRNWACHTENGDTSLGYDAWLGNQLAVHYDLHVEGVAFKKPPLVTVFNSNGEKVSWSLQHNLTDRWGDLNCYALPEKPALPALLLTQPDGTLDYLRSRMVTEDSFIAFKDGQFGLLHEIEYCSAESDGETGQAGQAYPREADLVQALIRGVRALAPRMPRLELAVLPGGTDLTRDGRPAVWAWASMTTLSDMTDKELDAIVVDIDRCAIPLGGVAPWDRA